MIAAGIFAYGCSEDDPVKPTPPQEVQFRDLTQKDQVLFNLQLSYNERRYDEYCKLLDESFRFYFADYDVRWRGAPEYWDRNKEIHFTSLILDPVMPGDNLIISIKLKLAYPDTNWSEEAAPQSHVGETWYNQVVPYELRVKTADDWEFRSEDQSIQITIRWDETLGHWRVVRMRDGANLTSTQLAPSLGFEPTYWGTLKAGFTPISRP